MNINLLKTTLLLALTLLFSQSVLAVKVYQWTDAEGIVHFSDTPPPEDISSEINETEMASFDVEGIDKDKYSIVNQLEQMLTWRRQAEEDQRAWKELELEEERLALEQKSYQPPAEVITESYLLPAYYPHTYYPRIYRSPYPAYKPHHQKRHGYGYHKRVTAGMGNSYYRTAVTGNYHQLK